MTDPFGEQVQWEVEPSVHDLAQMYDIMAIIEDPAEWEPPMETREAIALYRMAETGSGIIKKYRIFMVDSENSFTVYATKPAIDAVAFGWEWRSEDIWSDPNYQLSDEDIVEFDIPRDKYVSKSNPPKRLPPPEPPPPHGVDVRPRRRGPRTPREQ